ncbi:MAG: nucleotidyltransferase domain-containing protein [bacterium]|nr:nucleotidyltransferase domain-containing protein [bacterium]
MLPKSFQISKGAIEQFCLNHHIRKLSLFGSALTEQFNRESDIDVLVEFEPDNIPNLIAFVEMEDELTNLFGRRVDLNTAGFLSRHFRQKVLKSAVTVYEREG